MGRHRARRRLGGALVALVVVLAAAACDTMPEQARFSSTTYPDAEITTVANAIYGTAVDHTGATVSLGLDLYLPPDDTAIARPIVIVVHGGSFTGGNRGTMAGAARSYARRGFAAATISYRLDPRATQSELAFYTAVQNATDDGMQSVRWLRSKASTYHLDPTRVAMIGSSAGGAIALGSAISDDPTPTGPLAAFSPQVTAAVSTGASLTRGFEAGLIQADATDSPAYILHHDVDTATGDTFEYAFGTCIALSQVDVPCGMVRHPGSGHTVSINAEAEWWKAGIGPFLWSHLDLDAISG